MYALCGTFLTKLWAVLDIHVGRFVPDYGSFWFIGRFDNFPVPYYSLQLPIVLKAQSDATHFHQLYHSVYLYNIFSANLPLCL